MRVTLINPPVEDFYITGIRRQPLGLLYIASALRAAGYTPEFLNCSTRKKQVIPLPDEFNYLKTYIGHSNPELRFPFKNYTHYGMSWQEIELRIRNSRSDIYFISSLFTTYHQETERIISLIKKYRRGALIAAGGYHPSLHTSSFIERTGADYVIRGEGEVSVPGLVRALDKGGAPEDIPGVISRKNLLSEEMLMSETPDITAIPYPARDLLTGRNFKAYGKNFISMISSRGCPNRCEFCTGKTIWGNRYRERTVSDVLAEICECSEKSGAGIINFEDDNIFPSDRRAKELLSGIIELKKEKGSVFELTAMNGISIEKLEIDIVPLMKEAGFNELNISLVSQSADVQRASGRPFDSDKFWKIAEAAKNAGLNVRGYFILGLPGQSGGEIEDTIAFMRSTGVSVFPSVFYNVFSTEGEWKMQRSSAFYNESPELSRGDLIRYFNICSSLFS